MLGQERCRSVLVLHRLWQVSDTPVRRSLAQVLLHRSASQVLPQFPQWVPSTVLEQHMCMPEAEHTPEAEHKSLREMLWLVMSRQALLNKKALEWCMELLLQCRR